MVIRLYYANYMLQDYLTVQSSQANQGKFGFKKRSSSQNVIFMRKNIFTLPIAQQNDLNDSIKSKWLKIVQLSVWNCRKIAI